MNANRTVNAILPFGDLAVWEKFVTGLRFENRFTLSRQSEHFVEGLIRYAKKYRVKKFEKGRSFYRARKNKLHDNNALRLDEMGAPPRDLAGHGRLNPKGIPYLYLSSSKLTAISELRPWVGGKLTVAKFELLSDVNLINFSDSFFQPPSNSNPPEGAEFAWRELITWMFSAPFDPRDDTAYVPTQYLSERIKGNGFDGIIYDSAFNPKGYNVTLFNDSSVVPRSRQIAKVQSIKLRPTYQNVP